MVGDIAGAIDSDLLTPWYYQFQSEFAVRNKGSLAANLQVTTFLYNGTACKTGYLHLTDNPPLACTNPQMTVYTIPANSTIVISTRRDQAYFKKDWGAGYTVVEDLDNPVDCLWVSWLTTETN
jgi:hypothetical protein